MHNINFHQNHVISLHAEGTTDSSVSARQQSLQGVGGMESEARERNCGGEYG